MKSINVLSTFNGMGCIWLALDKQGIKVNKRYSSEIDKYANQVNDKNYPDTIQLGDITKIKAKDLDKIDLFVGGSPCQGFSFAGKQLAFDDPRSKLFFEFVRLWNEIKVINPDAKFLLENVKMKKNELRIISEHMGVFPVNINSNLVSAQNRNRWYWTNIKTKDVGLFAENWNDIPQPKDRGILLKDILQPESEINEKYYIKSIKQMYYVTNEMRLHKRFTQIDGTKTPTLLAGSYTNWNGTYIKLDKQGNKKADQNKAGCLTAGSHSGGNHSDMDILAIGCVKFGRSKEGKQIRRSKTKHGKDYTPFQAKEITNIDYEKMNTVTCATVKDNLLTDGYKLRRLTPIECERLQTVPDNYTDCVSDTQQYKMLGNGWTVEVIAHILSFIK
jgi:DNA (cytosine-5)-methyltransferase 3A